MVQHIKGDIFNAPKGSIIIQQVNCMNKMGRGFAKSIADRYPIVKQYYHHFCNGSAPKELLGTYHSVDAGDFLFANVFGQLNYGADGKQYTDYMALKSAFTVMRKNIDKSPYADRIICFPYNFGCGLAGGDWSIVLNIINECFDGKEVHIYRKER